MKKKFIIIGAIAIVVIAAVVAALLLLTNKKVTISFDSDGGKFVNAVVIKKGGSVELPKVEKEGFILDGWYLNDKRVTDDTTFNESVTLKAKWISEDAKTFTVTFDSDGGSKVESIVVECGKELALPTNPTKKGYTFVSWVDRNETPILDQALLACEDIALKANWKKEESKPTETPTTETTEPEKEKTYKCPSGYTLSGTKCISNTGEDDKMLKNCEDGYTYSTKQDTCYQSVSPTKVCKKNNNEDGVIIQKDNKTYCGYELSLYNGNEHSCEHEGKEYIDGKCYWALLENNYTLECESGYKYYTGLYFNNSQKLPVCAKTKVVIKTCPSDYSLIDDTCKKTIDATLE